MGEEASPRRVAARLTKLDKQAIELIKQNGGVVSIDVRGKPYLESNTQLPFGRFSRLQYLQLLEPSGDRLLGDSQTYRLVEA
jgi:hypothetical protein